MYLIAKDPNVNHPIGILIIAFRRNTMRLFYVIFKSYFENFVDQYIDVHVDDMIKKLKNDSQFNFSRFNRFEGIIYSIPDGQLPILKSQDIWKDKGTEIKLM